MGQKQSQHHNQKNGSKNSSTLVNSPKAQVKFTWRDPSMRHETVSFVSSFNDWEPIPLKYSPSTKDWSVIVNAPSGTSTYRYIVDGEFKYDNTKTHIIDKDGRYSNVFKLSLNPNQSDKQMKFPTAIQQNPNYRSILNDTASGRTRSRSGPPRPVHHRQPYESESSSQRHHSNSNTVKKSKSDEKIKPSDPENPESNVWGQEEFEFPVKRKYPPYLPPHTSYTLLNVAPGDAFNMPTQASSKNNSGKTIRWSDMEPLHVTLNHMYFAKNPNGGDDRSYMEMGLSTKYRGKSTILHIFRPKD